MSETHPFQTRGKQWRKKGTHPFQPKWEAVAKKDENLGQKAELVILIISQLTTRSPNKQKTFF